VLRHVPSPFPSADSLPPRPSRRQSLTGEDARDQPVPPLGQADRHEPTIVGAPLLRHQPAPDAIRDHDRGVAVGM